MANGLYLKACHESAHAVACFILGIPIKTLYVTQGDSECIPDIPTCSEAAKRGVLKECAIVAQVGPIIDMVLFNIDDSVACSGDYKKIERLLSLISSEKEREEFRRELPRRARELVDGPGFISAVRSLAEAVLGLPNKRKEITGDQVAHFLQRLLAPIEVTEEELDRRESEAGGRTLAKILPDLEKRA